MKQGFSLLEVIITISIIAVVGLISSTILTRTYRTNSDAEVISKFKQNGQLALNTIIETIRMAEGVVCYGVNNGKNDRIVVHGLDGKDTMFRFFDPVPPSGKITTNGYIAKYEGVSGDPKFFCTTTTPTGTKSDITDINIDTGVSISEGEFVKLTNTVSKDAVTIKFNIGPAGNQTGVTVPVNMQSTIQIR